MRDAELAGEGNDLFSEPAAAANLKHLIGGELCLAVPFAARHSLGAGSAAVIGAASLSDPARLWSSMGAAFGVPIFGVEGASSGEEVIGSHAQRGITVMADGFGVEAIVQTEREAVRIDGAAVNEEAPLSFAHHAALPQPAALGLFRKAPEKLFGGHDYVLS